MKNKNEIIYNCKENDAIIKLIIDDGKIYEIQVKIEGEKCWTVIGYNDLQQALKIAEGEIK